MSLPVVLKPEARDDLTQAHTWYESRRAGLGNEFLDDFERGLNRLGKHPSSGLPVMENHRLVSLDRFPYLIVYRADDQQITIAAVFHTSRHPRELEERL